MLVFEVWLLIGIVVAVFWPYFLTSSLLKTSFTEYNSLRREVRTTMHPLGVNLFNLLNHVWVAIALCAYAISYRISMELPDVHVASTIMSTTYTTICSLLVVLVTLNHLWNFAFFRESYYKLACFIAVVALAVDVTCFVWLIVEAVPLAWVMLMLTAPWQLYMIIMNCHWCFVVVIRSKSSF